MYTVRGRQITNTRVRWSLYYSEQLIRAYTAYLCVWEGVNVVKNFEIVRTVC